MPFRQTSVAGLPAISLSNDEIELVLIPSLGGKISNLRRRRGREWLWRSTQIPLARPPSRDAVESRRATIYVDQADSGGWDECFPTVGASRLPGANPELLLPDHGELWFLPWEHHLSEAAGSVTVFGRVKGERLPYEFTREITLDHVEPLAHFHYHLRHTGTAPFPYIWSSHPLVNVRPGAELMLSGVSRARVAAVHGRDDLQVNAVTAWPLDGGGDSYRYPEPAGWAVKLFADQGPEGVIRITDPGGEFLELRADPREVPQVGIWINCAGWSPAGKSPYYNSAIEPCIGAPDRLDQAVEEWKLASFLHPGEERSWRLSVVLGE